MLSKLYTGNTLEVKMESTSTVFGAVVTIPSEWPCKVSGDFVTIHRSRHQDDLWHCLVVFVLAQHQPQGSDAVENNVSVPVESAFFQPSQTKMLSSCNTKSTKIIPNPRLHVVIFHQHSCDHQTQKEVNVLISCRRRWETPDRGSGWWIWGNGYLLKLGFHVMSRPNSVYWIISCNSCNFKYHMSNKSPASLCNTQNNSPLLCQLLQPRNECEPHQSPSGWRWSIPGRWVVFFDALNHHDGIEGMKLWLWWGWNFPKIPYLSGQ